MDNSYDTIIIGAGVAGLAFANYSLELNPKQKAGMLENGQLERHSFLHRNTRSVVEDTGNQYYGQGNDQGPARKSEGLDKTEVAHKVGQAFKGNRRAISSGAGNQVTVCK